MTTAPQEFHRNSDERHDASDVAGDAASHGPAQTSGTPGTPQVPEGYPEQVDPAEGPLAGRDPHLLGDLAHPGAPQHEDEA
ncbi:hypothetical protein [Kineococcus sp. SYSU DK003]|uniref:hypothetical protein n=1 Tax=Kineococcus sp. SYSU DK003 TaxID=3383124 RepID=UPI003D7EE2FB